MLLIDSHIHLEFAPWEGHLSNGFTAAQAVSHLKSLGFSGAIFTTWRGVLAQTAEDLLAGNEEALTLYHQYPDFLYPGLVMHPDFPAESIACLKRFRELGLIWAGEWIPARQGGLTFDDELYQKLFKVCAEQGMIVQLHNSPGIAEVARKFPDLTIVASHITSPFIEEEAELENVYLDISGLAGGVCNGTLQKAKSLFGTKRLLYGTDFDGYDPEPFLLRVRRDFSIEEQENIFAGNVQSLLQRATPPAGNTWIAGTAPGL